MRETELAAMGIGIAAGRHRVKRVGLVGKTGEEHALPGSRGSERAGQTGRAYAHGRGCEGEEFTAGQSALHEPSMRLMPGPGKGEGTGFRVAC